MPTSKWLGLGFDRCLAIVVYAFLEGIVEVVKINPNFTASMVCLLSVVTCGLGMLKSSSGRLPKLGGLEGLLFVLTPVAALMLPMILIFSAPDGTFWPFFDRVPLIALFLALFILGMGLQAKKQERSWLLGCLALVSFLWLVTVEAALTSCVQQNRRVSVLM